MWKYYHSKILCMKYAWNPDTNEIMTEDQVHYNPKEIKFLEGKQISKEVHELKKIFKGEIVG